MSSSYQNFRKAPGFGQHFRLGFCALINNNRTAASFISTKQERASQTNFLRSGILHVAVAVLLLLPALNTFAQYDNGSLNGTIHDSTGASVPNVAITVTNVNTGITVKIASSATGEYEVPSLRVGVYNIQATAPGFAAAEAKNISIAVGGRQRIDLTLNVGQASATTVEVSDVALQLETETSEATRPKPYPSSAATFLTSSPS